MPAEGVPLSARGALLSRAELVRLARVFVAAGVDKVSTMTRFVTSSSTRVSATLK